MTVKIVSDHGFPKDDGSLPTDDPFSRFKNERDYVAQSGRNKTTVAAMDWAASEIDRLAAALSDQVGGWQDISTAPKDGSYVDLWFDKNEFEKGELGDCTYGRIPDCRWLADEALPGWYAEHTENGPYYIGDGATHWKYRPKSPSTAG